MEAARIPQPRSEAGALLAELFDNHGRVVLGICRAILSDRYDAEDAAQQTFLSAHTALLGGTRPHRPAAWLATIARNECRSRIASRLARPQAVPLLDEAVEARDAGPEEQAARNAELDALAAGVATLPERQREAVLLRDFFGLSYREVAAAMSVSEPAVESLLSRARRRLEDCVGPLHAAPGVLVVPQSLRDELAGLVPGFSAADAVAVGAGGGISAAVAKLAATPLAGKMAAGVAVGALVVGGDGVVERTTIGAEPPRSIPRERPAEPSTGSTRLDGLVVTRDADLDEAKEDGDDADEERDNSGPSERSGSDAEPDNSGPGSADSDADESKPDNSGPGSLSSGSGSGSEVEPDNSGPGSSSSGSGSSGSDSDSHSDSDSDSEDD